MRLGVAAAHTLLIVWCKGCRYQVEPDPAEQARDHGAATPVREWPARLRFSQCGSRNTDFVATGARPHKPA